MIFERTILYSPYNPYSIYFRMAVYIYIYYTAITPRALVYEVMQALYDKQ